MNPQIEYTSLARAESYNRAVDTVARERRYLATVEGFPLEGSRAYVDLMATAGWAQYFLIDEERVVGWCDITPRSIPEFAHTGVLGMGLLPEYRGMGWGRKLLDTAVDHARRQGLERVELTVFGSNQAAIDLYAARGFTVEGRRARARKLDGAYDDEVLMALILEGALAEPSLVPAAEVSPIAYEDYVAEWRSHGEAIVPMSSDPGERTFDEQRVRWKTGETDAAYATGFVPSFLSFLVQKGRLLGAVSFRPDLNERLLVTGGHIGYGIRPSERRRGWAKRLMTLTLDKARQRGLDRVLLTCDETNEASARTIEASGGKLYDRIEVEGVLTRRYWIALT